MPWLLPFDDDELEGTIGTDEDDLELDETTGVEDGVAEDVPLTIVVHTERETQVWLFSQPQPLAVFAHSGMIVPYQLHCWPPLLLLLELLTTAVELLERTGVLDGATELVTVPEQIEPVMVGTSAEPPRLST